MYIFVLFSCFYAVNLYLIFNTKLHSIQGNNAAIKSDQACIPLMSVWLLNENSNYIDIQIDYLCVLICIGSVFVYFVVEVFDPGWG